MPRNVGWEDETITGSFRKDDEYKYRGVKGETHIVRVMTNCAEIRVHQVDDVLEPAEDGEARVFNMGCALDWDEDSEDWTGECLGCEKDYDVTSKFVAGILHLATFKGRSKKPQVMDPENAVLWWPFGGDKYRRLSDLVLEQARSESPKKLHQLELNIKCEDETFQKLTISISQVKPIMNKTNARAYLAAWKEHGPKLVAEHTKPPSIKEQKRNLKPRRRRKDNASKPSKTKKPADDEEPEGVDEEPETTGDEDLDSLLADLN